MWHSSPPPGLQQPIVTGSHPQGWNRPIKFLRGVRRPAELLKGLQSNRSKVWVTRNFKRGNFSAQLTPKAFREAHRARCVFAPHLPAVSSGPGRPMSLRVEPKGLAPRNSDLWSPGPGRREGRASLPRTPDAVCLPTSKGSDVYRSPVPVSVTLKTGCY